MKPIYFIDMDGVIAKWNEKASEEETHMPGYFLNREADFPALSLVRILKDGGNEVCILSAVYEDSHSADEKRKWLDMSGLEDVDAIFVPYGANKHDYIGSRINGRYPVLIDDYSKNLTAWEKKGYLAIKYMNGINNRAKIIVLDGVMHIKSDTWTGYSIDNRMTPMQMYTVVKAVSEAEASAA